MSQTRLNWILTISFIVMIMPLWINGAFGTETSILTVLGTLTEVRDALQEKQTLVRSLMQPSPGMDPEKARSLARKHLQAATEIRDLAQTFVDASLARYPRYRSYLMESRTRITESYASIQKDCAKLGPEAGAAPPATAVAALPAATPSPGTVRPEILPTDSRLEDRLGSMAVDTEGQMAADYREAYKIYAGGSKQEMEEARVRFLKILEKKPDFAIARYWLGRIYLEQGDLTQAEEHAKILLSQHPKRAISQDLMADVLKHRGTAPPASPAPAVAAAKPVRKPVKAAPRPDAAPPVAAADDGPVTKVTPAAGRPRTAPRTLRSPAPDPGKADEDETPGEEASGHAAPRGPVPAAAAEEAADADADDDDGTDRFTGARAILDRVRQKAGFRPPAPKAPATRPGSRGAGKPARDDEAAAPASQRAIPAPLGVVTLWDRGREAPRGASRAEMILEQPAGEGRSRLLMVFNDLAPTLKDVGPLASVTAAITKLAGILGIVLAHGDTAEATGFLSASDGASLKTETLQASPPPRRSGDGVMVSLPGIRRPKFAVPVARGYFSVASEPSYRDADVAPLRLPWDAEGSSAFEYDEGTGVYRRVYSGDSVRDPIEQARMSARNVIVLGTRDGHGLRLMVHHGGTSTKGYLADQKSLLQDLEGRPIVLDPGLTWVICPGTDLDLGTPMAKAGSLDDEGESD